MVCITQAAAALASGHTSALALNRGRFLVHAAPAPNNINWQVSGWSCTTCSRSWSSVLLL
jgi:hypothetical protein